MNSNAALELEKGLQWDTCSLVLVNVEENTKGKNSAVWMCVGKVIFSLTGQKKKSL